MVLHESATDARGRPTGISRETQRAHRPAPTRWAWRWGPCPGTQNVHGAVHGTGEPTPNLFSNPDQAIQFFRYTATGFRGERNQIRADKYFSTDLGISKKFNLHKEGMALVFRWDIFNLTNSIYFDATSLSASPGSPGTFGDYTKVLGGPRQMQASLRFEF